MTKWLPIESNPENFNYILEQIGVKSVKTVDIYTFESGAYSKPPIALLLCLSNYTQAREILDEQYLEIATHGGQPPEDIFVAKQHIENACGTFALFNALANLEHRIDLGDGEFHQFLVSTKNINEDARSAVIETNPLFEKAHEQAAKQGQTELKDEVDSHYIAYVCKNNAIYEIDSRGIHARSAGRTTEFDFVRDAGDVIKNLMERLNSTTFSVIGVVPV